MRYPTEAEFEVTFEQPCQACGQPKMTLKEGGISASGRYRMVMVDLNGNEIKQLVITASWPQEVTRSALSEEAPKLDDWPDARLLER